MRLASPFVTIAATATLSSCAIAPLHHHSGTIERIEKVGFSGYVVSPRSISGYAAPWQMYVRLSPSTHFSAPRHVWIDFTDADSRGAKIGDHVVFAIRGDIPVNERISADSVHDLLVTPNAH